jgi:hypothetical protein
VVDELEKQAFQIHYLVREKMLVWEAIVLHWNQGSTFCFQTLWIDILVSVYSADM